MKRASERLSTVDLANCDREPIHIPGHVQPHGVLLAVDFDGRLTHVSRNAWALFPELPALGQILGPSQLGGDVALWNAIESALHDARTGREDAPITIELRAGAEAFDVVLHTFNGRLVVEFERRQSGHDDLSAFALKAHRAIRQLRSRRDIGTMMSEAVHAIQALTGFDRVMAYRFHQDDTGEIIAEAKLEQLDPYIGRRFPAADIPAQARHLYVRNPLRLIADVHDEQVPIDAFDPRGAPLDLSYAVLRSVSPIHIEYLKNIQVGASMSLSIVVSGRLWGLIACHHGRTHRVPYAIRMACEVLSYVLSSSVQMATERAATARRLAAIGVRRQLGELFVESAGFVEGFRAHFDALSGVLPCAAAFCTHADTLWCDPSIQEEGARQLLTWLKSQDHSIVAFHEASKLPDAVRVALQPFCSALAICFDPLAPGWLVLLRREQLEAITWSGPPEKAERMGPLGHRLTPGGSMAEWRQTVEGTSLPWDEGDRAIAQELLGELSTAAVARAARVEKARSQLLAVLGHDLRDPLQTISMLGKLIEDGAGGTDSRFAARIASSIGRMQRLIGDVFDMSQLHAGLGLQLQCTACDFSALLRSFLEDASTAHPGVQLVSTLPPSLIAEIDADRMSQAVGNLISNARIHGISGETICVDLRARSPDVVLTVSNVSPAIPAASVAMLFDPFKPRSLGNPRNPGGLGLGLYIAYEVAKGHRGSLSYSYEEGRVVFTLTIPLVQSEGPTPADQVLR